MPSASNQNAPCFDPMKPREFQKYFDEVAQLLRDCNITDETDQKFHTVRYVDSNTADTWKHLTEYGTMHNYATFKDAVRKLYPGSHDGSKWSISDLDKLIGETAHVGLMTAEDIAHHYQLFFNISEYLVGQGILACSDQSRMFVRVFQPDQLKHILNRLSIAVLNQAANVPYSLDTIHDAIDFIFDGPGRYFQPLSEFSSQGTVSFSPYAPYPAYSSCCKTEDFNTLFECMTQTIIMALNTSQRDFSNPTQRANDTCNGCSQICHYIPDCETIERLTSEGKCQRNAEGRVVLLGGRFVPHLIPGKHLAERIKEWHRCNP
ncbi:hypothetical protein L208DRAFT_1082570, partial [Tricholoma matsutake]